MNGSVGRGLLTFTRSHSRLIVDVGVDTTGESSSDSDSDSSCDEGKTRSVGTPSPSIFRTRRIFSRRIAAADGIENDGGSNGAVVSLNGGEPGMVSSLGLRDREGFGTASWSRGGRCAGYGDLHASSSVFTRTLVVDRCELIDEREATVSGLFALARTDSISTFATDFVRTCFLKGFRLDVGVFGGGGRLICVFGTARHKASQLNSL